MLWVSKTSLRFVPETKSVVCHEPKMLLLLPAWTPLFREEALLTSAYPKFLKTPPIDNGIRILAGFRLNDSGCRTTGRARSFDAKEIRAVF